MKTKCSLFLTAIVALLLSGCDTIMWRQYRVVIAVDAGVDEAIVRQIGDRVATRLGFIDRTESSHVKGTLALYSQPDVDHFRVDLGIRREDEAFIFDLMGGFGPMTNSFKEAQKVVVEELEHAIPGRYTEPSPYIPIN